VPFGFIPVVVGVGPNANRSDIKEKYDYAQYIVTPCLDSLSFTAALGPVRVDVKSWFTKATARSLGVFKGHNGTTMTAWLKALGTASEDVAVPEPVDVS
jgi:hypothetical protein